jgi:hypothetical protein
LLALDALHCVFAYEQAFFGTPLSVQTIAEFGADFFGKIDDVVSVITAFGYGHLLAVQASESRLDRIHQLIDLDARVVHVELAMHLVPCELEEASDGIADRCAATVPNVQRARRIRGNELDVDLEALAPSATTVDLTLLNNFTKLLTEVIAVQGEVDETGPRDVRLVDAQSRQVELVDDRLRQISRFLSKATGQNHGHVGGQVTVGRFSRSFELDVEVVRRTQVVCRLS